MKKFLIWLFPIFLICTFTACEQEKVADVVTVAEPGYTCTLQTEYQGLFITGKVTVLGADTLSFCVTAPETISGLQYDYDNGAATLTLGKTVYTSAKNAQLSGLAAAMNTTLGSLSGGREIPVVNGSYVYEGNVRGVQYQLTFNEEGFIKTLQVPAHHLNVSFSDWRYA